MQKFTPSVMGVRRKKGWTVDLPWPRGNVVRKKNEMNNSITLDCDLSVFERKTVY